jgi:hypothetical protein
MDTLALPVAAVRDTHATSKSWHFEEYNIKGDVQPRIGE